MGGIATSALAALRDYSTDLVPSSGPHRPRKADIRAIFNEIDLIIRGVSARSIIKSARNEGALLLTEAGRGGVFVWRLGDFTVPVAADTAEGMWIKSDAVPASIGAWVRQFSGAVRAEWWGIVADYDDDTKVGTYNQVAINAMLDALTFSANDGVVFPIELPAGKILMDQIYYAGRYFDLRGDSLYGTVLVSQHATADILLFGNVSYEMKNLHLSNITVDARAVKTGGWALRARRCVRSTLENVIICGQDRQETLGRNLFAGAWFDGCDFVIWDGLQITAIGAGLKVNGETTYGGAQGNLFIDNGKIFGCDLGIHVAGGFGGLTVGKVDVIANRMNMHVDLETVSSHPNREIFLQPGAFFDNSVSHNIHINAGLQKLVMSGGWCCSGGGYGLAIVSMAGQVLIGGGSIIKGNAATGIIVLDPATQIVFGGAEISNNGGYGLAYGTAPANLDAVVGLSTVLFSNNTSGSTYNVPFLRNSARPTGVDLEVDGITDGDMALKPAGTGVLNFDYPTAFTAGSPGSVTGYINIKINGTVAKIPVVV